MAFAIVPVTAADASFSTAGSAAWAAGMTVSGATAGGIPYCPTATTIVTGSGLTFNASGAAGEGLAIAAGTAASAVSALTLSQTWNYNAAAIQGVDWTFTDTSSHASTNAFRIRGGAAGTTDLLTLAKGGALGIGQIAPLGAAVATYGLSFALNALNSYTFRTNSTNIATIDYTSGLKLHSGAVAGWSSSADSTGTVDVVLTRGAAGRINVGTSSSGGSLGTIQCKYNSSDGTSGFTGTGAYTNFTFKDGIVTAAT